MRADPGGKILTRHGRIGHDWSPQWVVVQSLPMTEVTLNSLIDTLLVCCSVITVHSEEPDEPSIS